MKLYLNLTEKYLKSLVTVSITCHAIFMNISFIIEAAERNFIHHIATNLMPFTFN